MDSKNKKTSTSSFFSAKNKVKILAQTVGKPSGVIANVGGVDFNLRPFSFIQSAELVDLMGRLSKHLAGGENVANVVDIIGLEGPAVLSLVKSVLRRAAVGDAKASGEDFDEATFNEWFDEQELTSIRELLPKVLEANGLGGVYNANGPLKQMAESD